MYIKGNTPFHEFSAVLMLDDIQIGYYSSIEQKLLSRGPMSEEMLEPSDQKNAIAVFTKWHEMMRGRTHELIRHYNNTVGKYRLCTSVVIESPYYKLTTKGNV